MLYCVDDQDSNSHGVEAVTINTHGYGHCDCHHNCNCNCVGGEVGDKDTDCNHEEQEETGADAAEYGREHSGKPCRDTGISIGYSAAKAHDSTEEDDGTPVYIVESILELEYGLAVFHGDKVHKDETDERRNGVVNFAEYGIKTVGRDKLEEAGEHPKKNDAAVNDRRPFFSLGHLAY